MINLSKVKTLLKQIEDCACVVVGDSPYLHNVEILGVPGKDDENEAFLRCNWNNFEGQIFEVEFTGKSLSDAEIDDNVISLKDTDGDETTISLYSLTPEPVVILKEN